jgi:Zn-dependent oligopeptidase
MYKSGCGNAQLLIMKFANPFHSSTAILMGAIALVIGVRGLHLPKAVAVPIAATIAIGTATVLKSRQTQSAQSVDACLEQELHTVCQQALQLAQNAEQLRAEATQRLTQANQIELLKTIQSTCDRVQELPTHLSHLQANRYLSQQRQDVQAQVFSLSTALCNAAEVLQSLQTALRTVDLSDRGEALMVRLLSRELTELQAGLEWMGQSGSS